MKNFANKSITNLKPYKVASHKIWESGSKVNTFINKLDWNESAIPPSPKVKEALIKLIKSDFFHLYPQTFNEVLYNSLSKYVDVPTNNIQFFPSSDVIHEYIVRTFIKADDSAILLWPSYDNFRLTLESAGAKVFYVEFEKDFTFNKKVFTEKIAHIRPKLVYICNPNNPTGNLIDPEYINLLINNFPSTLFLIDEAYIEFCPQYSCCKMVEYADNLLISRTMSKAFGLANLRFGYLVSSINNISTINKIRNPKNVSTLTQEAVLAALNDIEYMNNYVNNVNDAKSYFIEEINSKFSNTLHAFESAGNFVLIRCNSLEIKNNLISFLENNNIFVRDVNQSDSLQNCFRITMGPLEIIKKVISLITKYFNS